MFNAQKFLVLYFLFFSIIQFPVVSASHKDSHSKGFTGSSKKHSSASAKLEKKYSRYKKEILTAFGDYKEKTKKVWGGDAIAPSAAVSVTYQNNLKQRSIMDFHNGKVTIELALEENKAQQTSSVRKQLASAVQHAILVGADTRSIIDIAKLPDAPQDALSPILTGLVADKHGKPLHKKDINDFLFTVTKSYRLHSITGSDGDKMIAVSTEFSLIDQHLIVRSKKYEHAVDRNAERHLIPAALIFAIMETESSFNPTAKSPVPAFGLMQLVPSQGARDAFRFLHSKDKVVNEMYLYQPDNNIDLGVAYLHMLYFRYLKYIKDPEAKQWAAVAAYNTGVSNVLRSFVGKYNRKKHGSRWSWRNKAMRKINTLSAEQVFKHMSDYLPYKETRDYINKVRNSMNKYHI